ncbi:MAG: GNAT family N-acetyltransferase [Alphaproteobacteria bacterium]|nr:GNAT family N-acetyltransferase [Alphaproteobacteria bacterium]
MRQDPVNGRAWAKLLEPAAIASWPPREVHTIAGWRLRLTDGFSHRLNSVAALRFDGDDPADAIAKVEAIYRARALQPMFQVTPAVEPPQLPDLLIRRGYRGVVPTLVCVAEASAVRARCPAGAQADIREGRHAAFDDLVTAGSHSPADGRERLAVLDRLALPHGCLTAYADGRAVSCGVGIAAKGYVGINMMRTAAAARRRGHARRVLGAIAAWADDATLFLQVEEANAPARALYEYAGFTPVYSYRHYRKDEEPA